MAVVIISEAQVEHVFFKAHEAGPIGEFALEQFLDAIEEGAALGTRGWYQTCLHCLGGYTQRAFRGEEPLLLMAEFWDSAQKDAVS